MTDSASSASRLTGGDPDLSSQNSYLVAIGASAGGLDALEKLFAAIPTTTGAAFVVIQHLSPDHKSMMASLLSRHTQMKIVTIEDEMQLQPDTIFLIPPGMIMRVERGRLRLTPKEPRVLNLPIDAFFHSAATDYGRRAVGVILSGTGSDGTRGVGSINEAGGMLVVQDPSTARFDGMPASAIATGLVDAILPIEKIGEWIAAIVARSPVEIAIDEAEAQPQPVTFYDNPMQDILRLLSDAGGINFQDYKSGTLTRRIERRMVVRQKTDLGAYYDLLVADNAELMTLRREILIPVTRFFRDTEAYALLSDHVIAAILTAAESNKPIRVWSAGTATGEEAYSLAMLFIEAFEKKGHWPGLKIFATDIEQANIDVASAGNYPESIAAEVPPQFLERFFTRKGEIFSVKPELRQALVFAKHNLLADPPFTKMDLVVCRNALIYFRPEAQERALRRMQYALKPGGYLFLGSSETLAHVQQDFLTISQRHRIWQVSRRPPLPLVSERRVGTTGPASYRNGRRDDPVSASPPVTAVDHGYTTLLRAYSPPPAILINQRQEVVHSFGDVRSFLEIRPGAASLELSRLLPDRLATVAAAILFKLSRSGNSITSNFVALPPEYNRPGRNVRLTAWAAGEHEGDTLSLLVFEEETAQNPQAHVETLDIGSETAERIEMLESELTATRESLQSTIEELETSNEELQATNEEMMASNEELQSANEELQSVNEELNTVNAEYQEKVDILNRVHADLDSLARIVSSNAVFVDQDMRLTRFSPDAMSIFRLREADIGRPISDLNHTLEYPALISDLRRSLIDSVEIESEVAGPDGRHFMARFLPYRVPSSSERAVVLTFVDITQSKNMHLLQSIIDGLPAHVSVLDSSGRIRMVNEAWRRFARENGDPDMAYSKPGANYLDSCVTNSDTPEYQYAARAVEGLRGVLSGRIAKFDMEYPCDDRTGKRWFAMHVERLPEKIGGIVISHTDVTPWFSGPKEVAD